MLHTQPLCGSSFIHYSDTSVALVNDLVAPVIDPGGNFVTCPGFPVTIGGNPRQAEATRPMYRLTGIRGCVIAQSCCSTTVQYIVYRYGHRFALGCRQAGQALVLTYRALAGPDKGRMRKRTCVDRYAPNTRFKRTAIQLATRHNTE